MPKPGPKRKIVLENILTDPESQAFVEEHLGAPLKEVKALKLAAENFRALMTASEQTTDRRSNELWSLKRSVGALIVSGDTKKQRLVKETARLFALDRRTLGEKSESLTLTSCVTIDPVLGGTGPASIITDWV
jgi:hypothetical protein